MTPAREYPSLPCGSKHKATMLLKNKHRTVLKAKKCRGEVGSGDAFKLDLVLAVLSVL